MCCLRGKKRVAGLREIRLDCITADDNTEGNSGLKSVLNRGCEKYYTYGPETMIGRWMEVGWMLMEVVTVLFLVQECSGFGRLRTKKGHVLPISPA